LADQSTDTPPAPSPGGTVAFARMVLAVKATIPAQNTPTPWRYFPDHVMVQVVGFTNIYDPSYGQTFSDLQDWQDKSLDGFYYEYVKTDAAGTRTLAVGTLYAAHNSRVNNVF